MSEQIHADGAEEQVSSDSGLLLSSEPLEGGRLSALGDDSSDSDGSDSALGGDDGGDSALGDSDGSDSIVGDRAPRDTGEDGGLLGGDDGGDDGGLLGGDDSGGDSDASDEGDSDGTDGGDSIESESGLGGENPLGLTRERVRNGDDKDTRDT